MVRTFALARSAFAGLTIFFALSCQKAPQYKEQIVDVSPQGSVEVPIRVDLGSYWKESAPSTNNGKAYYGIGYWLKGAKGEELNLSVRLGDPQARLRGGKTKFGKDISEASTPNGSVQMFTLPLSNNKVGVLYERPSTEYSVYCIVFINGAISPDQRKEVVRLVGSVVRP